MTGEALYQHVWHVSKRFFGVDEPPPAAKLGVDPATQVSPYPFVLRFTNNSGTGCGRCLWYKSCVGCPIEYAGEEVRVRNKETIAVDWNLAFLSLYFVWGAERKFENDESVVALLEEQNKPVSLDECLSWFTKVCLGA